MPCPSKRAQIYEDIGFVDVEVPEDKGPCLPSLKWFVESWLRKGVVGRKWIVEILLLY